jgi:hypothetical protein
VVSIDTVIAAMNPAAIHCARSWPSVNTRLMSGSATLTMVEDMIDAIVPTITLTSTHQR